MGDREGVKMIVMNSHEHIGKETKGGSLPNTGGNKTKNTLKKYRTCDDGMVSGGD